MAERKYYLAIKSADIPIAPMKNVHQLYQEYLSSDFRREWMKDWAGDDPEKQRLVAEILAQTTPM